MSTSSPEILNPAAEAMSSAARSAKTFTDKASAGIRNRVSQTCEQFTDSMDAVAQKLDVPAGIKDKWHATKDTAQAAIGQALRQRPAPVAAIVFAIFALLLLRRLFSQTAE